MKKIILITILLIMILTVTASTIIIPIRETDKFIAKPVVLDGKEGIIFEIKEGQEMTAKEIIIEYIKIKNVKK